MPHACHPDFISSAPVNSVILCYSVKRNTTRKCWPAATCDERCTSGRRLALIDDCKTEDMSCQIWPACMDMSPGSKLQVERGLDPDRFATTDKDWTSRKGLDAKGVG